MAKKSVKKKTTTKKSTSKKKTITKSKKAPSKKVAKKTFTAADIKKMEAELKKTEQATDKYITGMLKMTAELTASSKRKIEQQALDIAKEFDAYEKEVKRLLQQVKGRK